MLRLQEGVVCVWVARLLERLSIQSLRGFQAKTDEEERVELEKVVGR